MTHTRRAALLGLALMLAACGSPTSAASSSAGTTQSPAASPSPSPAPVESAVYLAHSQTSPSTSAWALHQVDVVAGGVPQDRVIASGSSCCRQLLTAGHGSAVVLDGNSVSGADTVQVVDLTTGQGRSLGPESSMGIGAPGPVGAAMSPDGSQVAIGGGHRIVVVELSSGAVRRLVSSPDHFFMPLRWTPSGIVTNEVPYADGGPYRYDLLSIDPTSGAATKLRSHPVEAISPDARTVSVAVNTNLGDSSCALQFPCANTLTMGEVGGQDAVVVKQKYRNFAPLSVSDSGELLYVSDTFPNDSGSAALAPDMGLYVAVGVKLSQQFPEHFIGEWEGGALLDPSTALVGHVRGTSLNSETGIELLLVHLCPEPMAGCQASSVVVSFTPGHWPTVFDPIIPISTT